MRLSMAFGPLLPCTSGEAWLVDIPNPKANAPAALNSLQRVVSFRMVCSFAFDPEAPGSKPPRQVARCSVCPARRSNSAR
jgi:hypothetical protein